VNVGRALTAASLATLALTLGACNDLSTTPHENPYSGGSIPWGKGPVTAAGFVVDGANDRGPVVSASVSVADGTGRELVNETDSRGVFYIDGIGPGLVAIRVGGGPGWVPFEAAVSVPTPTPMTASLCLYPASGGAAAPDAGAVTGFMSDLPPELALGGETRDPGASGDPWLAGRTSFLCIGGAAVVDRSGQVLALAPGNADLHAFFEGQHFEHQMVVSGMMPGHAALMLGR
jgi:hypothetical protein